MNNTWTKKKFHRVKSIFNHTPRYKNPQEVKQIHLIPYNRSAVYFHRFPPKKSRFSAFYSSIPRRSRAPSINQPSWLFIPSTLTSPGIGPDHDLIAHVCAKLSDRRLNTPPPRVRGFSMRVSTMDKKEEAEKRRRKKRRYTEEGSTHTACMPEANGPFQTSAIDIRSWKIIGN